MNQDQVKELLLKIEDCSTDFTVTFSGKQSSKVNGLYKPMTNEIIIHNKNFENDQQLIYTAIHEYAHHLHSERNGFVPGNRAHPNAFWVIFHGLLDKAEKMEIYKNPFDSDPRFVEMTRKIRELMPENGKIMLDFGKLIVEAEALCRGAFVRFEDYLDRALGVQRTSAVSAMKAYGMNVPAEIGWDAMKIVSGIKNPEKRNAAIDAFKAGETAETVKAIAHPPKEIDPKDKLAKERSRLEKTIETLQSRLAMVEDELAKLN